MQLGLEVLGVGPRFRSSLTAQPLTHRVDKRLNVRLADEIDWRILRQLIAWDARAVASLG